MKRKKRLCGPAAVLFLFTIICTAVLSLSSCTARPLHPQGADAGTDAAVSAGSVSAEIPAGSGNTTAPAEVPAGSGNTTAPAEVPADSRSTTAAAAEAGENRDMTSEQEVPDTITLSQAQSAAKELSGKYSLDLFCGDDVPLLYADFTAVSLSDPWKILQALEVIDQTLSLYPPGFFISVREGFCDRIAICLARDLHARGDDDYMESANAFTTVENDTIWLVLDAEKEVSHGTLIHELTHVTDYRLLGMHQLRESEWNRLNPEDFSYYNAYLDENGVDLRISGSREYTSFQEEDLKKIWFYDPYSKTFAMEDRARLMEKLLEEAAAGRSSMPDRCFSSPHIQTKLRFYFYTLRQAFETSRWPEETSWEELLHKAENSG